MDGTAKGQWDNIDSKVHSDDTYRSLRGVTIRGPSQRSWATFVLCMDKHKLVVFGLDAANQTCRYLQQGIRKPFEVRIKFFMQQVQAINRDLAFMPCLRLNMQADSKVVPTNIPFNRTEMCDIIIRSPAPNWQAQYKVSNGQVTPTKPDKLLKQLV